MASYNHLMTWLGTGGRLFPVLAVLVALMVLTAAKGRRSRLTVL
jgi:hypothetical protein